jgi:hypothetical protein
MSYAEFRSVACMYVVMLYVDVQGVSKLYVVILSTILLSIFILSVIMQRVVTFGVVILSLIRLFIVMLSIFSMSVGMQGARHLIHISTPNCWNLNFFQNVMFFLHLMINNHLNRLNFSVNIISQPSHFDKNCYFMEGRGLTQ